MTWYGCGKVNLSLCFNWAPRHEGVMGSGGIAPGILDLALDGGELSASLSGRSTPQGKNPWYLWHWLHWGRLSQSTRMVKASSPVSPPPWEEEWFWRIGCSRKISTQSTKWKLPINEKMNAFLQHLWSGFCAISLFFCAKFVNPEDVWVNILWFERQLYQRVERSVKVT
jgi:hypothetical protein